MAMTAGRHLEGRDPDPPGAPDEQALAAVPRRVARYLRFLGCDRADVHDLVQETMVAAVGAFAQREPPLPWLLTVARNALRMHFRRHARRREVPDLDRLHELWVEQVRDDGGDAQRDALRECLRRLPERSRLLVHLRYRDGMSREQLAARLGLRAQGVKSLLQRVRSALGECIRRRLGDKGDG